ncbi:MULTISPECIES: DUF3775 domain-containing protein [Marinobacter]|uniref:DUF3775 domain-containing protein n=1 Tax=Marinobacter profundi TaxID=2666256 RepID=A0A2G1UM31_9GAMM|nr:MULTISPECIES: DUF3775 domain-containing protein [Marinobacter]MBD3655114.1 DUF3775 domain-containing protein [Marinobacter sp.]PHQ15556.1 hypothetical protein CLH61_07770 [Marinobacter profundi]
MLDVNPDTVCRLIQLAREFHAQEEVVIPNTPIDVNASDDWHIQMLASHAGDATLAEFRSIIDDLEPDQQQQVVALLWLGRGDYSLDEWSRAVSDATDAWNEYTADYLIAHPLLPDYLAEGLDLHDYSCD